MQNNKQKKKEELEVEYVKVKDKFDLESFYSSFS